MLCLKLVFPLWLKKIGSISAKCGIKLNVTVAQVGLYHKISSHHEPLVIRDQVYILMDGLTNNNERKI